jgi:toxin-antitoxin system PIN domain toxin
MQTKASLLDLNVLIALAWPQHIHFARAHAWFAVRQSAWMTTPLTETGFIRLSTNPSVVSERISMADALALLSRMRAVAGHVFLPDATSLADPVVALAAVATSRHVTDAHLVNLAASSDARLATFDRGIEQMLAVDDRRHVLVLP